VSSNKHQKLAHRKRKITQRLRPMRWAVQAQPMLRASSIHYDEAVADFAYRPTTCARPSRMVVLRKNNLVGRLTRQKGP